MRIRLSQLRRVIREEVHRISEATRDPQNMLSDLRAAEVGRIIQFEASWYDLEGSGGHGLGRGEIEKVDNRTFIVRREMPFDFDEPEPERPGDDAPEEEWDAYDRAFDEWSARHDAAEGEDRFEDVFEGPAWQVVQYIEDAAGEFMY